MEPPKSGFLKKAFLLSFLLIVVLVSILLLYNRITKRTQLPPKKQGSTWLKYDSRVDFVSGDGRLITLDKEQEGGIIILEENHKEQKEDLNITVRNLKDDSEKKFTVLKEISEFASVKFLPNKIDGSKLWLITYNIYSCEDLLKTVKSTKEKNQKYSDNCGFKLYEFDLTNGNLTFKKDGNFWLGREIRGIYPLTHDPVGNTIWFAVDYRLENLKLSTDKLTEAYLTDFINYNANTNEMGFPVSIYRSRGDTSHWSPYIKGLAAKAKIADIDKNGDLFVVTECGFEYEICSQDPYQKETSVYRISAKQSVEPQVEKIPLFTYAWPLLHHEYLELAVDPTSQVLYLATKTWDSDKESVFFSYDIKMKRTTPLGGQPTQYEDDVLGISTIEGKLLAGTFNGLGVYDQKTDKWKVLTTENGLKDNHVETIYPLNNGGLCVLHENKGASCLQESP
jgi:hypothetical protein